MKRIYFTTQDLARTHLAAGPDALWEVVMALHVLQARYGRLAFADWRHQARSRLQRRDLTKTVIRHLYPIAPVASYFPDFLTPLEGLLGLEHGIEAILATPRKRIRQELTMLHVRHPTKQPWLWQLADRPHHARTVLADTLRRFHQTTVAPYWPRIRSLVDADRATRVSATRSGDTDALLNSFRPMMRWKPPILEVSGNPPDRDIHLDGRGLLLIPSYFCWNDPVTIFDPALPPTVVYPIGQPRTLDAAADLPGLGATSLSRLLGGTRARILRAAAASLTTSDLARILDVSPTTVSDHTAVLREAGLLTSHRHANTVVHIVTPLGTALINRHQPTA